MHPNNFSLHYHVQFLASEPVNKGLSTNSSAYDRRMSVTSRIFKRFRHVIDWIRKIPTRGTVQDKEELTGHPIYLHVTLLPIDNRETPAGRQRWPGSTTLCFATNLQGWLRRVTGGRPLVSHAIKHSGAVEAGPWSAVIDGVVLWLLPYFLSFCQSSSGCQKPSRLINDTSTCHKHSGHSRLRPTRGLWIPLIAEHIIKT